MSAQHTTPDSNKVLQPRTEQIYMLLENVRAKGAGQVAAVSSEAKQDGVRLQAAQALLRWRTGAWELQGGLP